MLRQIFFRTHRFRCPDEHQLAAWVDQQLIGSERERVESHLAKCDSCLQQVGFLVQNAQGEPGPAPARLLRRAQALDAPAPVHPPAPWKWAAAAAAIVLLAASAALWREARSNPAQPHSPPLASALQSQAPDLSSNPDSESPTSVRGESSHLSPAVLSPQPGATVPPSDFLIRWQPMDKAAAYEVSVVTAAGDLVWRHRLQETSVKPPPRILRPGRKYFVWIRALLRDGKTQQSPAVGFIGG